MSIKGYSPIIILGMHRSGTSLLAGSLESAGLLLGEVNNAAPHNKKGNKENIKLRDLNDRILARNGADWRTPPASPIAWTDAEQQAALEICETYLKTQRKWGFKDPRTLWTLEGWLTLFPDSKLIGIFRHPALVMHSLNDRPGDLKMSPEQAETLWIKTNEKLLARHHRTPFPLLHFDASTMNNSFFNPLDKWTKKLGLKQDSSQFFRSELVHQTAPHFIPTKASLDLFEDLIKRSSGRATALE